MQKPNIHENLKNLLEKSYVKLVIFEIYRDDSSTSNNILRNFDTRFIKRLQ